VVQGGVSRVPVHLGSSVALVVSSDVADEVHLHGYNRKVDVPAGGTATLEFVADQAGVFEAELESRGTQLVQLEVR
jgi:heme/copper-type cytochrome/quinol oxidase subunit 2